MKSNLKQYAENFKSDVRSIIDCVPEAFAINNFEGVLTVIAAFIALLIVTAACLCEMVYELLRLAGRQLRRAGAWLHTWYKAFLHRHFDNIGLVGGFAVVLATSYGLFLLDPQTPTLSLATVQVLVSAPLLLFVQVHTAIWCYKHLLPEQFKQLMGQLGEKLNESVLPDLDKILKPGSALFLSVTDELAIARFTLNYHLTKFGIRCTRFVLYGIPFYLLFKAMEFNINLVLNLQPH